MLSAFILVGGRSSRMGRDKASLQLNGRTLLDRALSLARSVTSTVFTVGADHDLQDRFPGAGPLAGIHAALRASSTDLNLVLAVDTPFLTSALLRFLIAEAERSPALATIPRAGGRLHPLCGVYRRAFADAAEQALSTGQNKIDALFATVPVRIVEESELHALDFTPEMFDNLNTPDDWQRAQARRGEPE